MTTTSTDCLVLKIEEYSDGDIDTTLFVLYDVNECQFLIFGKRCEVFGKPEPVPYTFKCNYAEDLADFISFAICKKNKCSYTLYNYDNLPENSDDITFEYLKEHDGDLSYEISGYDNKNYNRNYLVKSLRMLRNVFNYY